MAEITLAEKLRANKARILKQNDATANRERLQRIAAKKKYQNDLAEYAKRKKLAILDEDKLREHKENTIDARNQEDQSRWESSGSLYNYTTSGISQTQKNGKTAQGWEYTHTTSRTTRGGAVHTICIGEKK